MYEESRRHGFKNMYVLMRCPDFIEDPGLSPEVKTYIKKIF
jgi:hypothetical protein